MLIHRLAVALFLGLHHLPGGDQFGVRGDKIGTHRVGQAVAPEQTVWNVGDVQTLHEPCGDDLVEGLLLEGGTAALDETAGTVHDLPALSQIPVGGIVRGAEVEPRAGFGLAEEHAAHVVGEGIVVEIDGVPDDPSVLRANPIVIGETQSIAAQGQQLRAGQSQRLQSLPYPDAGGGDAAACPPLVQGGPVHLSTGSTGAHREVFGCVDGADMSNRPGGLVQFQRCHCQPFVHQGANHG